MNEFLYALVDFLEEYDRGRGAYNVKKATAVVKSWRKTKDFWPDV